MIRRPPRSTHCISSAASDVYKRQAVDAKMFQYRFGEYCEIKEYMENLVPAACRICKKLPRVLYEFMHTSVEGIMNKIEIEKIKKVINMLDKRENNEKAYFEEQENSANSKHGLEFKYFVP
eukprot:TRINITY_DN15149_c0_g1_i1.p1 TRINITY_DN15149_c0_g1~~TRINITY_DN15149_c0_g1_i1.p1  ORF type:complete len:129 (-),score=44.14 TRINITY_DN15149_c0_g1_i1:129-491(-)